MRDDAFIRVNEREASGLDVLLLRQRQQHIEKSLVGLEHLNEFHQAAVRHVQLPVKPVCARVRFRSVIADGGEINAPHELRNVLGLGVRGHKGTNAHALFLREENALDRYPIDVALIFFPQGQRTQGAEFSLHMDAGFLLELATHGMGDEIQRILVLWAFGERIHGARVGL